MSNHLVSVVLATYNRGSLLPRAIASVLDQTHRNIELIIVDDGSRDKTSEIVRSFSDSRVRMVRHKENRGAYRARNTGIRLARGDYIAFQDSDDWWESNKLAEEINLIRNSGEKIGAVYSRLEKTFFDGKKVFIPGDSSPIKEGHLFEAFLRGDFFITLQALLVKRKCFEMVGMFDENLSLLGDMEFLIRLSRVYDFLYNSHVRIISLVSPDSHSRNSAERLKARDYIFQKHLAEFKKHPAVFAKNAYIIGNAYALRGEMEKAHEYLLMAWSQSPFTVKYFATLFLARARSKKLYRKVAWMYTRLGQLFFKEKKWQEITRESTDDFAGHGTPNAPKRN